MYTTPLISELEILNPDVQNVCKNYVKSITKLILAHSQCLAAPIRKRKRNKMTYVSLPTNVKSARKQCKAAFDSWKNNDFNTTGEIHDDYRFRRKEYRSLLRDFLNQLEVQKIDRLCTAAETDEKLFWKLLKGQRNSSQMHAFLVEGKLLSDVDQIRDMWANYFEALGTPFASSNFDNDFYDRVTTHVHGIFINCTEDSSGVLNEPLQYEEVAKVCSRLKRGTSGVLIDYEHILFAGPPLWKHLFCLFQEFFLNGSICSTLKTGIILPLFKGKGAKANNKENYRGITLFPTLCKIYEIILLNRLENYASHNQYFSEMQFGFQEGVGCTEASFTILETINHMLERGSKIFGCFLDVRKAFDTVWIDGLLYKLFTELGIKGRMWVAIKDLYTDVKARVLYSGSLSRSFDVSQGTGQGRILAPFMYKVYINSLLHVLTDHCYSICINSSKLASPSFSDDVSLIALHPSFLTTFMNICHEYSLTWRYEFNHSKSGIVTFGETKTVHHASMNEREWRLGDDIVQELYEYKNLGVLKNYIGSFSSNVRDNIEKTRKKAGMIFSSSFDRRKTNPLIFVKFWRQACLPSLLFGSELFSLTPSLLLKLERCQLWFLKNIFYLPSFAHSTLVLKISGLNSIESEIDVKRLLFLGRLITQPKTSVAVRTLFQSRTESFFDVNITSIGVVSCICEALQKYDLFDHFKA